MEIAGDLGQELVRSDAHGRYQAGFLPDVGGTYFLSRLNNHFGLYLALTGRAIGPADAYYHRLVSHYIPAAHFHVIKDALSDNHPIDRLLDGLHRDPGEGEHARLTPAIQRVFGAGSVEEILQRLDREEGEHEAWAKATAAGIREKSPTSLKVAFTQMQRGKALDLAGALRLEFRLASQIVELPDYAAGITARIMGKGAAPRWQPATLAEVDDAKIEHLFSADTGRELDIGAPH